MNNIDLPSWRQKLKASQMKEGNLVSNRWIQIANISKDQQPRVRTVVFRGWLDSNKMLIFTDKRSEKFNDLKINNKIEILWLFFKSKSQYRFKGKAYTIDDDTKYWNNLSDESKITWFWPCPGEKLVDQNRFISIDNNCSKPSNFSVFQLNINEVDLLKLEKPVHKRYIWKKNDEWKCIQVNP